MMFIKTISTIIVLLLSIIWTGCSAKSEYHNTEGNIKDKTTITVEPKETLYEINPELFGVCPMFWLEDDKAMEDGKIEQSLKDMKCRFLRFPGGTESDNFDWRTNELADKRRWPWKDGKDKMTTDKFIDLCRRIGAEPILCTNTEIAFFKNDSAAIELASEWVRYCNIEKGYNVKYWEIGNEPYYHSRFNAKEYAELLSKMSLAMKSVDPTIRIVAVGEWNPYYTGIKEEIEPKNIETAQELELQSEMGKDGYAERFHKLRKCKTQLFWWQEVMKTARGHIDAASIHWYYNLWELKDMTKTLNELSGIINPENEDKQIELIATEWSLHENVEMYGMERALTVGEAVFKMADGHVEKTNYWPLRCGGIHDKKGLLDMTPEKNPHANLHVLKFISQNIGDKRIYSDSTSDSIYHFATRRRKRIQIFVINRSGKGQNAEIKIKGKYDKGSVEAHAVSALNGIKDTDEVERMDISAKNSERGIDISVPAYSIAVCSFKI